MSNPFEQFRENPFKKFFAEQAEKMDETDLSIARAKNDPFGEFLREQAENKPGGPTARAYSEDYIPPVGKIRAAVQGATFGFGDELIAGAAAGGRALMSGDASNLSKDYQRQLYEERGRLEAFEQNRPIQSTVSEIAGALLAPGLGAARGGSMAAKMGTGGIIAALEAAGYKFGTGEGGPEKRMEGTGEAALMAAPFGMAGPKIADMVGGRIDRARNARAVRRAAAVAPDSGRQHAVAKALFDQADKVGGLPRIELRRSAQRIVDDMLNQGMSAPLPSGAGGTPGAYKVTSDVLDAAADPNPSITFREMDRLRAAAQGVANKSDRHESMLGNVLIEEIDKVIDDLDPATGAIVKKARQIWGRLRRSELIETAINRADLSASGFENGLRREFTSLLNNPKKMRGFSDSEVSAMREVVKGGTFGNIMRKFARVFSFGKGRQTNVLGGGLGGAGAYAAMGPVGPVLTGVTGRVAQELASSSTGRKAELARKLSAVGGAPVVQNSAPIRQALTDALIRRSGRLPTATDN